jgi:hypothetical protein
MRWVLLVGVLGWMGACNTLSECDCFRRTDCNMVKETCWCASACGETQVACLECTATKFIRCEAK